MPKHGLTLSQKAVLIKAYKQGGLADDVREVTGHALERDGYGLYGVERRTFYPNRAGVLYAATGKQIGDV